MLKKIVARPRPVSHYLAALCLALTLPVLAVTALIAWNYAQSEVKRLKAEVGDINARIVLAVERQHRADIAALRVLAASPALATGDLASFQTQAEEFARSPHGLRLILKDAKGDALFDSGIGKNIRNGIPKSDGNPVISGLLRGPTFEESAYQIVVPARPRDGVQLYLIGRSPLRNLTRLIGDHGLDSDYLTSIADRDGAVLARSADSERHYGKAQPGLAPDELRNEFEWSGVTADGIRVFGVFNRVPTSGWGVTTGVSEKVLHRPVVRSLLLLSILSVAVIAICVGIAWKLSSMISRAARSVADTAVDLGLGKPIAFSETPITEANIICRLLVAASNKLQEQAHALIDANRFLEKRIAERTRELSENALLLETALAQMDQGILVFDQSKHIQLYNSRAAELAGVPESFLSTFPSVTEFIDCLIKKGAFESAPDNLLIIQSDSLKAGETIVNETEKADGTFIEIRTVPLADGRMVRTYTDATARKRSERRLENLAQRDPLTGLPNRSWFNDKLNRMVGAGAADKGGFAVMMLHFDGLRDANLDYSFAVGDALLVQIAEKLTGALDAGGFAARMRGSLFGFVQPMWGRGDTVADAAAKLTRELAGEYEVKGVKVRISVNIGGALFPADGKSVEELKRSAKAALYRAKQLGPDRCCVSTYEPVLAAAV